MFGAPPSYNAAPIAFTVLPEHTCGIDGTVQDPDTVPLERLIVESLMPVILPPSNCTKHEL